MINTQVGGVGGSLRLDHAILMYSGSSADGRQGLVTINPVRIDGDNAVIAPGQPASKAALIEALDQFADRSSSRSETPRGASLDGCTRPYSPAPYQGHAGGTRNASSSDRRTGRALQSMPPY